MVYLESAEGVITALTSGCIANQKYSMNAVPQTSMPRDIGRKQGLPINDRSKLCGPNEAQ
jgi:hypothetical protein